MEPNFYLATSSLLTIFPMTLAARNRQWELYFPLLYILICSIFYHSTKNYFYFWMDQTACFTLAYTLYNESVALNRVHEYYLGGGSVILLYAGGYLTQRLIWSPNFIESTICHMLMHIITMYCAYRCSQLKYNNKKTCRKRISKL
jgi:hypothetical protein